MTEKKSGGNVKQYCWVKFKQTHTIIKYTWNGFYPMFFIYILCFNM